jgi:hypothetical protein
VSTADLVIYDGYLKSVRASAAGAKSAIQNRLDQIEALGNTLDRLSDIKDAAHTLDGLAEGLKAVMKLISKIGPLKVVAQSINQALDAVEKKAEQAHDLAQRLEQKLSPVGAAADTGANGLKALILALDEAIAQLDSVAAGVGDTALAVSQTQRHLPGIFGAAIGDAASAIRPVLAAAGTVEGHIALIEARLAAFSAPFDGWDSLSARINDVIGRFSGISDSLSFLKGPLEAIETVIKPIEWALDAIDFIFNLIVAPVLNPILDATGVTDLMKRAAQSITALLPDLAVLDPLEAKAAEMVAALAAPLDQLGAAIHDFSDGVIRKIVLGPLAADPTDAGGFAVGNDAAGGGSATAIKALGGHDVVAGGLGNDTLHGDAGNDLLIGGAGDDTLDGGDGSDVAIFLGNFREFTFAFPAKSDNTADPTTVVVTHARPPQGGTRQGVDTVTNVEHFAFFDETFDLDTLQNMQVAAPAGSTLEGGDAADILIGGAGDDTIRGNGGDDYIYGGAGKDVLTGGDGDDTFAGLTGGDRITDFTAGDRIIIENLALPRSAFRFDAGKVAVDVDGFGTFTEVLSLNGDFSGGDFIFARSGDDTIVTFRPFLPELAEKTAVRPDAVNGIVSQGFLTGDGTGSFRVTLAANTGADYNNALGVYEVDRFGRIVDARILFDGVRGVGALSAEISGVENGNRLGFFIVQNGADFVHALGDGDALSFVDASGAPATVFSSGVRLAVNGKATEQTVFHSFAAGLNADGVQHALSGVKPGGEAITVGFEDETAGGDRDYQDVVFTVEWAVPEAAVGGQNQFNFDWIT